MFKEKRLIYLAETLSSAPEPAPQETRDLICEISKDQLTTLNENIDALEITDIAKEKITAAKQNLQKAINKMSGPVKEKLKSLGVEHDSLKVEDYLPIMIAESSLIPHPASDPKSNYIGYFQIGMEAAHDVDRFYNERGSLNGEVGEKRYEDEVNNCLYGILYYHLCLDKYAEDSIFNTSDGKEPSPSDKYKIAYASYNLGPTKFRTLWKENEITSYADLESMLADAIREKESEMKYIQSEGLNINYLQYPSIPEKYETDMVKGNFDINGVSIKGRKIIELLHYVRKVEALADLGALKGNAAQLQAPAQEEIQVPVIEAPSMQVSASSTTEKSLGTQTSLAEIEEITLNENEKTAKIAAELLSRYFIKEKDVERQGLSKADVLSQYIDSYPGKFADEIIYTIKLSKVVLKFNRKKGKEPFVSLSNEEIDNYNPYQDQKYKTFLLPDKEYIKSNYSSYSGRVISKKEKKLEEREALDLEDIKPETLSKLESLEIGPEKGIRQVATELLEKYFITKKDVQRQELSEQEVKDKYIDVYSGRFVAKGKMIFKISQILILFNKKVKTDSFKDLNKAEINNFDIYKKLEKNIKIYIPTRKFIAEAHQDGIETSFEEIQQKLDGEQPAKIEPEELPIENDRGALIENLSETEAQDSASESQAAEMHDHQSEAEQANDEEHVEDTQREIEQVKAPIQNDESKGEEDQQGPSPKATDPSGDASQTDSLDATETIPHIEEGTIASDYSEEISDFDKEAIALAEKVDLNL